MEKCLCAVFSERNTPASFLLCSMEFYLWFLILIHALLIRLAEEGFFLSSSFLFFFNGHCLLNFLCQIKCSEEKYIVPVTGDVIWGSLDEIPWLTVVQMNLPYRSIIAKIFFTPFTCSSLCMGGVGGE